MKFRRRSSRFPSINWGERIDRAEPLKGQLWTRSEKALKEPDVHWSRRAGAGALAILVAVLLGWIAFGPAFAIHDILVSGAQHMTPQWSRFLIPVLSDAIKPIIRAINGDRATA